MMKHSSKNQYLATILCGLGPLCIGLLIGWFPLTLPLLLSKNTPLEVPLTLLDISWLVSLENIGKFAGIIIFGYIIDIIGRKITLCISVLPILVSTLLVLFAKIALHINLSRLFLGLGEAGAYVSVPLYIAEISEIRIRGKLGSIFIVNLNIGISLGIILGSVLSYYTMVYILLAVTSVTFVLGVFLPESPMFLLWKGRKQEADKSMRWFHGKLCEEDQKELKTLTDSSKATIVPKETSIHKCKQLRTEVTLKGLFIGIMIFVFQQGSGYFSVLYYSPVIFEEINLILPPIFGIIIVEVWKIVPLITATLLIEKTGRRRLLLISSSGVAVSLFITGLFLYLKYLQVDLSFYGWILQGAVCIYTFLYSIGLEIVPFVIVTEIFSPEIKGVAVSICMLSYFVISFIFSKLFSPLVLAFGWPGCFWFFGIFSVIGTLFLWIFVLETKQRTTDAILKDI